MKRTRIVIVAGLLLLVAVGVGVGGRRARAPATARTAVEDRQAPQPAPTAPVARADQRRARTPPAAIPAAPLPAAELPVTLVLPELHRRADAGDARAGCRLAFELMRCAAYTGGHDEVARWLRQRAEHPGGPGIYVSGSPDFAHQQVLLAERARECAAIPATELASADNELYRAALAGNLEATLRYIDGQGFGLVGMYAPATRPDMSYLRHPGFTRWQREAPRLAQALLRAGEPAILEQLQNAYLNDASPFAALVPDDPARAFAIFTLDRRRIGLPPQEVPGLTPADHDRADAILRELLAGPLRDAGADAKAVGALMHPAQSLARDATAACE
jgi:hypothetical protein